MKLLAVIGVALVALTAGVAPAAASIPPPVHCKSCWHPRLHNRWQYQLQGSKRWAATGGIDVGITSPRYAGGGNLHPHVWDFDLFVDEHIVGNSSTLNTVAVDAVHNRGGHAICYVDAGTWENWRADAGKFPRRVLGKPNGWPGERWLDIRKRNVLRPIMTRRIHKCARAGFDAVEFDNVDAYTNSTGFPLTAKSQRRYNVFLANTAHRDELSAGLKNDLGQIPKLKRYFDFAINEQCMQYHECKALRAFTREGKPVFEVEYGARHLNCGASNRLNFNAILKRLNLYASPWTPCR
jgi:endo-alpha-1,4-polygalactosaminidase (GH114 family)